MPNPSAAKKTVSAHKKLLAGVVVAAVLASVGVAIAINIRGTKLHVAGQTYHLELATTEAQQEEGLGDRNSMPVNHGMLFTYTKPDQYCYWMKGMRFPLDIIWFDAQKHVVKIEQNLQPSTYPKTYCPDGKIAQYVIELNAGQVAATHLQLGQQVKF